jgi:hypothetical protein
MIRISKAELELLSYLHEHATRFDRSQQFQPTQVATALATTPEQLQKSLSFLSGYGLVGTIDTHNSVFSGAIAIWLSQEGENLMRKVEADLEDQLLKAPDYHQSRGIKITLKAAGWLMDTAQQVVVQVVAKAITG